MFWQDSAFGSVEVVLFSPFLPGQALLSRFSARATFQSGSEHTYNNSRAREEYFDEAVKKQSQEPTTTFRRCYICKVLVAQRLLPRYRLNHVLTVYSTHSEDTRLTGVDTSEESLVHRETTKEQSQAATYIGTRWRGYRNRGGRTQPTYVRRVAMICSL